MTIDSNAIANKMKNRKLNILNNTYELSKYIVTGVDNFDN